MLTVAKFPHAQASCAMLLDGQHCKATWVSLFTTGISFCWFVKYAENVKMGYKGVKLNPFEVLITGWRCFVWFLKPFQLFFLRLWTYTENRRAMWTFATWQHILSVNQTFSTSLTQTDKKELKTKGKRKGKTEKHTNFHNMTI